MTIKIKMSTLTIPAEEFARRVESFIGAMKEYAAHLEGVEADELDESLSFDERRIAFPPPSEEPIIEQAAREGYELAGPTLEEKKAALFAEVRRLEAEAMQAIMPSAKLRHWQFREHDIRTADHARLAAASDEDRKDPGKFIAQTRSAADDHFLNKHTARKAHCDAIARHAAKHEHDIADLSEENVDHYVIGGTFT